MTLGGMHPTSPPPPSPLSHQREFKTKEQYIIFYEFFEFRLKKIVLAPLLPTQNITLTSLTVKKKEGVKSKTELKKSKVKKNKDLQKVPNDKVGNQRKIAFWLKELKKLLTVLKS